MQTIIPAKGGEGVVQVALRLPLSLRNILKNEARRQGRSLNTHLVMTLGDAAGGKLGGEAPAAENDEAALACGPSINQMKGPSE